MKFTKNNVKFQQHDKSGAAEAAPVRLYILKLFCPPIAPHKCCYGTQYRKTVQSHKFLQIQADVDVTFDHQGIEGKKGLEHMVLDGGRWNGQ